MSSASTQLADLRREIDEIDDAIHDLLLRRGDLQERIADAKTGSRVYMRPGREAIVLRRLLDRHRGPFPKAVLVRIWREIFSAGLMMQDAFSVATVGGAENAPLRSLARDHFGSLTPIRDSGSPQGVLKAVVDGEATVGVLPMPEPEESDPWWRRMIRSGDTPPRVIARLPFAPPISTAGGQEALAIGMAPIEETGKDRSYVAVETGGHTSRSALRKVLESQGYKLRDWKVHDAGDGTALYLVELEGYLDPADPQIRTLAENSAGSVTSVWPLGGYAVPPTAEELA